MKALEEYRARLEAATPGPWIEYHENGTPGQYEAFLCPPATGAFLVETGVDWDQKRRNAEFIAHAPTDTARLLTALEAVLNRMSDWERKFTGNAPDDVAMRAAIYLIRQDITEALGGKL